MGNRNLPRLITMGGVKFTDQNIACSLIIRLEKKCKTNAVSLTRQVLKTKVNTYKTSIGFPLPCMPILSSGLPWILRMNRGQFLYRLYVERLFRANCHKWRRKERDRKK